MPKFHKEDEDPNIGLKFGKGGHLEIVGWWEEEPLTKHKLRNYKIKCSECAKDPELFGEGFFKSIRNSMVNGQIPCGCAVGPKWTQKQYLVILSRLCEKGNFEVTKIQSDFIDCRTKIDLNCLSCNYQWTTNTNSLQNGSGCAKCAIKRNSEKRRNPDEDWVKKFEDSGKFVEGTIFHRDDSNDKRRWNVYCPICSNDEYVQAGVCTGEFRGLSTNLEKGKRPCRCSHSYKWTKEQREYKIRDIAAKCIPYYTFRGWVDENQYGAFSKFKIECEEHGEWLAGVDKFVNMGQRCPGCSPNGGFSTQKTGYLYVLRVSGRTTDFTGYGISNVPDRRLAYHRNSLDSYGYLINTCSLFEIPDGKAFELEQVIKKKFPVYPQEMEGFKTEATYPYLYENLLEFVEVYLKQQRQLDKSLEF